MKKSILLIILSIGSICIKAQERLNTIAPAAAFLGINPSARLSSMGGVGVTASSNEVSSSFWNPAKLSTVDNYSGVSINHVAWLQSLYKGVSLSSIYTYINPVTNENIKTRNVYGAGVRYFSKGDFISTDKNGNELSNHRPYDFSVDLTFAKKINDNSGFGINGRIISSSLGQSQVPNDTVATARALGFAIDLGYYNNIPVGNNGYNSISYGVALQNLGPKLKYSGARLGHNLPTNIKVGATYQIGKIPTDNIFSFSIDLNKLLVPTPPLYDENGNIIKGKNPRVSVFKGIIQSFSDAPDGFKEELREIQSGFGFEMAHKDKFFLRTGFSLESKTKGDRNYATLGAGFKSFLATNQLMIDLGYIIPFNSKSVLKNTYQITASIYIDRH